MTGNHNRIPRHWNRIECKALFAGNAGIPGDVFEVTRGEYGSGHSGINRRTGQRFSFFMDHLRNGDLFEILVIE